jgi:hypothetical protein
MMAKESNEQNVNHGDNQITRVLPLPVPMQLKNSLCDMDLEQKTPPPMDYYPEINMQKNRSCSQDLSSNMNMITKQPSQQSLLKQY